MSAKRLQNLVDKQKQILRNYLPEGKLRVATKIAPEYQLKGAARVARETYQDPNFREADTPENILESMAGKIYQHEEGVKLIQYMMDKGVYQHNKMQHTKDAIKTFEEILTLDTSDPMVGAVYGMCVEGMFTIFASTCRYVMLSTILCLVYSVQDIVY